MKTLLTPINWSLIIDKFIPTHIYTNIGALKNIGRISELNRIELKCAYFRTGKINFVDF